MADKTPDEVRNSAVIAGLAAQNRVVVAKVITQTGTAYGELRLALMDADDTGLFGEGTTVQVARYGDSPVNRMLADAEREAVLRDGRQEEREKLRELLSEGGEITNAPNQDPGFVAGVVASLSWTLGLIRAREDLDR